MSDLESEDTCRSLGIAMKSDFESKKGEVAVFIVIIPIYSDINA